MACAEAEPGHRGLRATCRETKPQIRASVVTPLARFSVLRLNVRAVHQGSGAGEVTVPGARRGPRPSDRLPRFRQCCLSQHHTFETSLRDWPC